MNDRNDKQTRLLAESFHSDWATGHAAQFASAAAAYARQRRRRRQALASGAALAAVAIGGFLVLQRPMAVTAPTSSVPQLAASRGYEVISDEQFLAQVRDRPVLVVRTENGAREIIVLANE